jgi:NADPH:quinone reductase-like Zn-dependent oxidoreductase/acyl carrier protein
MWGIGRAVAREHPELRTTLVDLSAAPGRPETRELARRIGTTGVEDRIALRNGKAYLARLSRLPEATANLARRPLADNEAYRLSILKPGILDHLELRVLDLTPPAAGEVEIEVVTAGLNFIDVAKAMGIYPGLNPEEPLGLGLECAGRIISVGAGVTEFAPGDEVIAVASSKLHSMFTSRLVISADWVMQKPARLSFEEAATTPIVFLTAYYSLVEMARMRRGEWVLIHAAAGGVGIAAIQIAKWVGTNVIATVGSPEKEAYVRSLGVEHVFNSRSLDFAADVMKVTEGRGVDIVLNSLGGEFIDRSFEVLASYGRFVELGKRDIYDNRQVGLYVFRKNIAFYVIDLAAALEERPREIRALLQKIMSHISNGDWQPLPVTAFTAAEPSEAFRFMAQARHIGKIAIRMDRDVQVLPASEGPLFSKEAAYLITGGLGGIALRVAEWMAANGAGHLALVSRRAVNKEAAQVIRRIEEAGTTVQAIRADITSESDIQRALSEIRSAGHPLRGIMHTAAVVDDSLMLDLTRERFLPVMAPKIEGTWKLHVATLNENLDFFVLFSSIAAIHPQPGMGSYATANAFLDAFAHYRRALDLPAMAVNWGGWNEIGLAREAGTERSIQGYVLQGMPNFTGDEALQALGLALRRNPAQTVAVPFEWKKFAEFHGQDQVPPLFKNLVSGVVTAQARKSDSASILDLLADAESVEQQVEIFEAYLQETLGQVLKLSKSKIDRERALGTMGLDSLMGLEFVRRLSSALQIAVPATVVFNYPTIRVLTRHLLQRMQLQPVENAVAVLRKAPSIALPTDISEEDALQALIGGKGNA